MPCRRGIAGAIAALVLLPATAPRLPGQPPAGQQPQGQQPQQPQAQQPQQPQPQQPQPQQPQPPRPGPPGANPQGQGVDVLVDERVQQLQGKTIRSIRVLQIDAKGGVAAMTADEADAIVRSLQLRVGQAFEARKAREDNGALWFERRLAVDIRGRLVDDQVELYLLVLKEVQVYERVEFQGLKQIPREEVDALLGLHPDRQVTSIEAVAMRNVLIARYKRDGYAFCSIALDEREPAPEERSGERPRKILTFRLDEGPKVTIGSVHFRGNVSFPAEPALGLFGPGDFLVRDAHIQSSPGGIGAGGPFSREVLEEDLDRLRLFYRSRGFLDATVTVADMNLSPDRPVVDLDFQVVEGRRYSIKSIRLVHIDEQGKEVPESKAFYKVEEVAGVLRSKVGAAYDHDTIRRDLLAIQEFYGKRGHPAQNFPGMQKVPGAFRVGWPKEFTTEDARVELTFELLEGTPKTLRDVLIRGNQFTRDKVIRRKVYAMPGERVDMEKINKSLRYLEQTRFFQDPTTLQGPRFELLPVPDRPDALDLAIDLKDGETGEFRWGVGISTGSGAQATLQFNKRNFDLWNPPSSLDPGTMFGEIIDSKAFHGGGQNLDFLIAPGTEVSQFQVGFTEPDLFGEHFDTIEMRLNGRRRIRRFREGYTTDTLGVDLGLFRNFSEEFSAGLSFREESVSVEDVAPDATSLVFDAEGQTELRGIRMRTAWRSYDDLRRPSSGIELNGSVEMIGGLLGGEEDLWKVGFGSQLYAPLGENAAGHHYVLRWEQSFGLAHAFGQSNDVFLTERYYLGGADLRGFDFRGAGPSQFGHPLGGEARYASTFELSYPLVATRLERDLRDREVLRGVVFVDFGLLGLAIDDPTMRQPRLSYGVGVRIEVPVLEIPIQFDLAWPILYEETDDRRQVFFSIARF